MVGINYAKLATLAASSIAANGKPITIIKGTGSVFDPAAGTKTGEIQTNYTGSCVEIEFSNELQKQGAGVVQDFSKRVIATLPVAPTVGDDLAVVDGGTWNILKVQPLSPASVVLYYDLWLH